MIDLEPATTDNGRGQQYQTAEMSAVPDTDRKAGGHVNRGVLDDDDALDLPILRIELGDAADGMEDIDKMVRASRENK